MAWLADKQNGLMSCTFACILSHDIVGRTAGKKNIVTDKYSLYKQN
jgi:hypothetical protein